MLLTCETLWSLYPLLPWSRSGFNLRPGQYFAPDNAPLSNYWAVHVSPKVPSESDLAHYLNFVFIAVGHVQSQIYSVAVILCIIKKVASAVPVSNQISPDTVHKGGDGLPQFRGHHVVADSPRIVGNAPWEFSLVQRSSTIYQRQRNESCQHRDGCGLFPSSATAGRQ